MRRSVGFIVLASFAAAVAASAACGGTKVEKKPEYVIATSDKLEASIFKQNCAICHGNEANGKEIAGVKVPSLRYGPAQNKSEEEIYTQIKCGRPGDCDGAKPAGTVQVMPSFRDRLSEDDIRKMTKFVLLLQGR
jgi:mono/diheme cytochrome c family protein